tara:strand:- start:237 stop:1916 length:1680 start_codon:yes stop_codon:yes gene_type:complete
LNSSKLTDFRNFLFLTWKHLNLPEPTSVQYDIASYLQSGPRRLVIEAFRGVGKSYITSAFVVHQLLLNPELKVLVVSASKNRSDDFSTFTQRLINDMPVLHHLKPREEQRASKISFDVGPAGPSHSPSVKSVGITGQLAGSRADIIVADDIEIPNNSATQMMRDKLGESVKEFDAILKPDGRIIYLGTPQTEMSLYEELPNRGYEARIWPARYPSESVRGRYSGRLAPKVADLLDRDEEGLTGQPTDPKRFTDEDLLERELSYGRSGFSLQFMLDTSLSDADRYPLKLNDLIVMPLDNDKAPEKVLWGRNPQHELKDLPNLGLAGDKLYGPQERVGSWLDYTGSVLAIDPSGRGADETAYAVVKMLNGQLFVTDAGGVKGGYSAETLQQLANIAKKGKVNEIIIESNFGDGMFTELFKPVLHKLYEVTVNEVRHSKQKELRIVDTLEPVMNQHRLVFDPKVIERDWQSVQNYSQEKAPKYTLMYQMTRVTKERGALAHDDRLDALSMAVAYWVEQMASDADKAIVDRREELLMETLERFSTNTLLKKGREPVQSTWFSI